MGEKVTFRPSTIAAPQEVFTSVKVFSKSYDKSIKKISVDQPVRSYLERVSNYDKNIYH